MNERRRDESRSTRDSARSTVNGYPWDFAVDCFDRHLPSTLLRSSGSRTTSTLVLPAMVAVEAARRHKVDEHRPYPVFKASVELLI